MRVLPADGLERFEALVEKAWLQSRLLGRKRDALVIGLGLCGLRWEECSRSLVMDLGVADGTLRVRSAKKGVPRTIPVGRSWMAGWLELVAVTRPGAMATDALFVTSTGAGLKYDHIRRTFGRWTKKFWGQAFTFHCLRHTAAWRLYQATHDVLEVQRFLGHRSLRHTAEYLKEMIPFSAEGMAGFVRGEERSALRVFDPDGLSRPAAAKATPASGARRRPAIAAKKSTARRSEASVKRCVCRDACGVWEADGVSLAEPFGFARRDGVVRVGCKLCSRFYGVVSAEKWAAVQAASGGSRFA